MYVRGIFHESACMNPRSSSCWPITREMPFANISRLICVDLPGHYLAWFARQGFPTGELVVCWP